jgi:LPS export ABC transporter protein LptC
VTSIFFSCQTESRERQSFSKQPEQPTASSVQVEWLYTKNGQASFVLKSPTIERYGGDEPYLEFPKGLEINSFEITGQKDASLRADYAIKNLSTSIIEARGMVILENAEGEKLETEYLIWDENKEQIYTKEFVKITKSNQVIMGEGFVSDIYFSKYSLKKSRGAIEAGLTKK